MKDPPNDPKTLYETREQGSIKLASLGMTSKPKASKREVHCSHTILRIDIRCKSFTIFVCRVIFTLPFWDSYQGLRHVCLQIEEWGTISLTRQNSGKYQTVLYAKI
jgi:hypothetical protein